jgi:sortase (surface protein transpeptidase)
MRLDMTAGYQGTGAFVSAGSRTTVAERPQTPQLGRLWHGRGDFHSAEIEGSPRTHSRSGLLRCPTMQRLGSIIRGAYRVLIRPVARLFGDLFGLVPALLAGAGVFFVVAGLFTYLQPAAATTPPSPSASIDVSVAPYTIPPFVSAGPSGSAAIDTAVATRVQIPALGIDMPIIASPAKEEFPLCNTAEYITLNAPLGYPGMPQATYLYAHARTGMFLPLLNNSKVKNGAAMIGMWVEVYTDNSERHVYEITEVIRHQPDDSSSLSRAASAKTDQLWLQTSEGPYASSTKLQVVAEPVGVLPATQADSHPTSHGNVCPDAPICKVAGDSGCRP